MTQVIPLGLCQCGCGEQTSVAKITKRARGHVAGVPVRFLPGHHFGDGPTSPVLYIVDPTTGCWVWQRATTHGYAVGRGGRAHRVFYEEAKGPIPEGLQIDHLCRNRACVNPDHLEAVTAAENQRRGANTKLTADNVRAIKGLLRAGKATQTAIAERFGVCPSTISLIASGRRWGDVQ